MLFVGRAFLKRARSRFIQLEGSSKLAFMQHQLQFPNGGLRAVDILEVCSCELGSPLFYCLIGRDVLSRWVFTYDGPVGTWKIKEEDAKRWIEPTEATGVWGK